MVVSSFKIESRMRKRHNQFFKILNNKRLAYSSRLKSCYKRNQQNAMLCKNQHIQPMGKAYVEKYSQKNIKSIEKKRESQKDLITSLVKKSLKAIENGKIQMERYHDILQNKSHNMDPELHVQDIVIEKLKDTCSHDLKRESSGLSKHSLDSSSNDLLQAIKPQNLQVYILYGAQLHMTHIKDIPWSRLNEEVRRLHTFCKYPLQTSMSAILLAADGFAYIGTGQKLDDAVICCFCTVQHKNWLNEDDIHTVHSSLKPTCPMVTHIQCNNVPMVSTHPREGHMLFSRLSKEIHPVPMQNTHTGKDQIGKGPGDQGDVEFDAAPQNFRQAVPNKGSNYVHSNLSDRNEISITAGRPRTVRKTNQLANHSVLRGSRGGNRTNTTVRENTTTTTTPHQVSNACASSTTITSSTNDRHQTSDSSVRNNYQPQTTPQNLSNPAQPTSTIVNPTDITSSQPAVSTQFGSQTPNNENTETTTADRQGGPYHNLGIITERPKRFEYAVKVSRLRSFDGWARDHHLTKEVLANAGFYYAGYGDCARCFYCGGGLRNWEPNDDVWVEHARWFPKCAFMRQTVGQSFIDEVQILNKSESDISFDDVLKNLGHVNPGFLNSKDSHLKNDPAVVAVQTLGYDEKTVCDVAKVLKDEGFTLSSDNLFEKLQEMNKPRNQPVDDEVYRSVSNTNSVDKDIETISHLKEKNSQLRQQTVCKICMDSEVAIVFLPCGHFVSCSDCVFALQDCPVCRQPVKGIIRAFMG